MTELSILVLDAWRPAPDRDGASLRIVNLLSILRPTAGKLTFGFGDPPRWRAHYESWQPPEQLSQGGSFELLDGHAAIAEHLAQEGHEYDLVILSRLSMAKRYFQMVRQYAPGAALVFDTTDLHHLRGFRGAKVTGKINLLKSALLAKQDELSIVRQADCTLVVSPVEKEILEKECPGSQIRILSLIQTRREPEKPFSERYGILFVGAFPHHPNIDAMEYFYSQIYPLVQAKLPGAPVTIIGSDPPNWLVQAGTDQLIVAGHVPDISPALNTCRLTIAPLRYGAGIKGKVLLSMGYGVPVVASPAAAEGIPAENGRDLLVADTPQGFAEAIFELHTNERLWTQMSMNSLEIIERTFSFAAARRALTDLLDLLGFTSRTHAAVQNQ